MSGIRGAGADGERALGAFLWLYTFFETFICNVLEVGEDIFQLFVIMYQWSCDWNHLDIFTTLSECSFLWLSSDLCRNKLSFLFQYPHCIIILSCLLCKLIYLTSLDFYRVRIKNWIYSKLLTIARLQVGPSLPCPQLSLIMTWKDRRCGDCARSS